MDDDQTLATAPESAAPEGLPHVGLPNTKGLQITPLPTTKSAPAPVEESDVFGGKPEGAPSVPVPRPHYQEQWDSGQVGPGLTQRPSKFDQFTGGLQEGIRGSFEGGLLQKLMESNVPEGRMLDPKEANALNPDRAVPYTSPVASGVVAMEAADVQRRRDMDEWLSRGQPTWGNRTARRAGQLAGGFGAGAFDPINWVVGAATDGLGELALPEAAGFIRKYATKYLANVAGFSALGAGQSEIEHSMGAKRESATQIIEGSLLPAGIATGIGGLLHAYLNRGEMTREAVNSGIRENALALMNDERVPNENERSQVLAARRAGQSLAQGGAELAPTLVTSPIAESKLYGAVHADGRPMVYEHMFGEKGRQLTDSYDTANNGVSRSSETPGQLIETKLPEGAKVMDLSQAAETEYASRDSVLKSLEKETGVPLQDEIKKGQSVQDFLKELVGKVAADNPEAPVIEQFEEAAQRAGYSGLQFDGGTEASRFVHVLNPENLSPVREMTADPQTTEPLPSSAEDRAAMTPEQRAEASKVNGINYSENLQAALDKIRKNSKTLHPEDLEAELNNIQKVSDEHLQQLQAMAKDDPSVQDDLDQIRKQDAKNKRLMDVAKRIADCGASE